MRYDQTTDPASAVAVPRFSVDMASLSWIVARAPDLSDAVLARDFGAACLALIHSLLGLVTLISQRTLFRAAGRKQGNPLRPAMRPHRAVVLLMPAARLPQLQAPNLTDAADIAMLVFTTSALDLGACAERPPIRRGSAARIPGPLMLPLGLLSGQPAKLGFQRRPARIG
jgi:hypothetical protein